MFAMRWERVAASSASQFYQLTGKQSGCPERRAAFLNIRFVISTIVIYRRCYEEPFQEAMQRPCSS